MEKNNSMKNYVRKKIKCLVAVLAVIVTFGLCVEAARAEDFEKSRDIRVNEAVIDSLDKDNDVKYYRFTTSQDGYVKIHFSNPLQGDTKTYWKAALYTSAYEQIWEGKVPGNKEDTDFWATGLSAGTYYVKVTGYNLSTDTYALSVNFTASRVWEKEINDEFVSATPMELNTDYYGTLVELEEDYYKIVLEEAGKLSITFQNPLQPDSRKYWEVYLYNDAYEEIWKKDVTGNNARTECVSTGLDKGTYYILVKDYHNSPDEYTLRAGFTASDVWEKEFNEDFASATPIVTGTTYFGAISGGGDKDVFRLAIQSGDYYRIQIETPNLGDSRCYWKVKLYDGSYQELASISVNGNRKNHNIDRTLSAGTYYITVEDYNYSSAVYKIKAAKWMVQPSQVKASRTNIHSLTAGRKSISVQFDPIDLKGIKYQIAYRAENGKVKTKSTSKTTVMIKNLSAGKYYYIRVRAYKKIDGKIYYGQWSDTRSTWVQ